MVMLFSVFSRLKLVFKDLKTVKILQITILKIAGVIKMLVVTILTTHTVDLEATILNVYMRNYTNTFIY